MAKQTIFLGLVAGDGTGEKLRVGGDMINDNFDELYAAEVLNTAKITNQTHTGDATGSGALTLANTGVVAGTYYNATVTVDAKGRATVVSTGNHTGDVTGSQALTLATVNLAPGTYTNVTLTVNAKGLVTAASSGVPTFHQTLTANATTNVTVGDITTDHCVIVEYALFRGALYQMGRISLLSRVATVDTPPTWDYTGDDVGLTISANINGNNIRLNMTVDNSSATNITMNYVLTIITL